MRWKRRKRRKNICRKSRHQRELEWEGGMKEKGVGIIIIIPIIIIVKYKYKEYKYKENMKNNGRNKHICRSSFALQRKKVRARASAAGRDRRVTEGREKKSK